jgi:hypothetical protein
VRGWWKRSGPRLRLSHAPGAFPVPGGNVSPLFLVFGVENAGDEAVDIARVRVESSGRGAPFSAEVSDGERQLPCRVGPGESVRFWSRARGLAEGLKEAGYGEEARLRLVLEDPRGVVGEKAMRFPVGRYLRLEDE